MITKRFIEEAFIVDKRNIKVESVVGNKKRISIFGEHQAVNLVNKNVRVYTEELWNDLLNRKDFIEAQNSNRLLGFLGHPDLENNNLDYTKFSHYTKNVYREGDIIYGTDYPTTSPMGELLTNYMLEDGIQFGISSRGYGESKQVFSSQLNKYVEYMLPGFVLEGWDFVLDPSCYIAFPKVKLESRQYLENWSPLVSVLKDTVYSHLDEDNFSKDYYVAYKDFIEDLVKYPNQPVVKNFVEESLYPVLEDLNKNVTNGGSGLNNYYPVEIKLVSSGGDKLKKEMNEQVEALARNYNKLLEEYKNSVKVIDKYEQKFSEMVKENNKLKVGELGDNINTVSMGDKEIGGEDDEIEDNELIDSEDTLRLGEDEGGELDSEDLSNSGNEKGLSYFSSKGKVDIPVSVLKKLNLRAVKDLGESLSVLDEAKKYALISSMFKDDETLIKEALYELVSEDKVKESHYGGNRDLAYRFDGGNSGRGNKLFKRLIEMCETSGETSSSVGIGLGSLGGKKRKKLKKLKNLKGLKKEEVVRHSDITIPDRDSLTNRLGDTVSFNYLGNEAFSPYVESMELSNIDSPIPVNSWVMVVKDYEHPASTSHLRRGERLFYKGYYKGNWNNRLEKIAVLKLEYDLLGVTQTRYVTMKLEDMYNHVVHVDMSATLRDSNLPFSGYLDTDNKDNSVLKDFQVRLEERLKPKPLYPDSL